LADRLSLLLERVIRGIENSVDPDHVDHGFQLWPVVHSAGRDVKMRCEILARQPWQTRLPARRGEIAIVDARKPKRNSFPEMAEHDLQLGQLVEDAGADQSQRLRSGFDGVSPSCTAQHGTVVE